MRKKIYWFGLGLSILLFISVCKPLQGAVLLNSFESEQEISQWETQDAKIERVGENVTEGKYAGKVTFSPSDKWSGWYFDGTLVKWLFGPSKKRPLIRLNFPEGEDWSDYGMIACDIYNPCDFPLQLYIEVGSPQTYIVTRAFSAEPQSRNTYDGCLLMPREFIEAEDLWSESIQNVKSFALNTNPWAEQKEMVFYIDNIRLLTQDETLVYFDKIAPLSLKGEQKHILKKEHFVKEKEIDITLKPSPYLKLTLSPPYFENTELSCRLLVKNIPVYSSKAMLVLNLEKKDKIVGDVLKKEIYIKTNTETELSLSLSLEGVKKGQYDLVASLFKDDKILTQTKEKIWIYPQESNFFYTDEDAVHGSSEELVTLPQYEEMGFYRESYGPAMVETVEWYTALVNGKPGLKDVAVKHFQRLADKKIPFYVCLIHGWMVYQPYELLMERSRLVVRLAEEIGGDLFKGVHIGETSALRWEYRAVQRENTRLGKADTYIKIIQRLRRDLHLPPGKELMLNLPHLYWGLEYEAGADLSIMETPTGGPGNFPLIASEGRGTGARSFHRDWLYCITLEPNLVAWREDAFYWNKKTLRYDPSIKSAKLSEVWDYWASETLYKILIEKYYQGTNGIWDIYRPAFREGILTKEGEIKLNFLSFIEDNPRSKDVVSKVAILRSKGDYWGGPVAGTLEDDAPSKYHHIFGLGTWVGEDGLPFKEETDYIYLNLFYPDFSDDLVLSKNWWTGTPYGAIDVIYPAMKLKDMKRYNSIIFLGYNRIDSVRRDFLNDLINYVKDGGIILLSIDQLRDSQDKLNLDKLSDFLGAKIGHKKRNIKDCMKIVEGTIFKIKKKRYPIASELKRYEEKEPYVYEVIPKEAKVVATDNQGIPVLLLNKYDKGYVLLFTSPALSMIPGSKGQKFERSKFVEDVIDKVAKYKSLPVGIFPEDDNVEFLISKTENKEATIFIMNHGAENWSGDIIINLKESGFSKKICNKIVCKISKGYEVEEIKPEVARKEDNLIIKGVSLSGDTEDFCSYREASFALVKLSK